MNILKSDIFIFIILFINIILLILYIINTIKLSKIRKEYKEFMMKLGEGKDIEEQLKAYMDKVIEVKNENVEIKQELKKTTKGMEGCMQKVGLVRYNAFKDTGSNLSFSLALLNQENTGIVLNGIYSREMSNIYAKPVENGKSEYTLSEEETQAILKAMNK